METRSAWVFFGAILLLGGVAVLTAADLHLPGNHQGYEPVQPIAYSHRLHAGELEIDCLYCHFGATRSQHAGIPPASVCMNCHQHVTAGFDAVLQERERAAAEQRDPGRVISPELQKLYDALGLDEQLNRDPSRQPQPIEWVRVHQLPDHVHFDHRVHVQRGLACEQCHGPVRSMERVRQESDLSMGWCVQCHRSQPARPLASASPAPASTRHVSTDCASCHF